MSERHGRGGGYRRRYHQRDRGEEWALCCSSCSYNPYIAPVCIDDYDDRRRDYETPDDKLKAAIIKLGEVVSINVCDIT
jgi:nuclear cap-binding protein subunit 1